MLYQLTTHRFPQSINSQTLNSVFAQSRSRPESAKDFRIFRGIFGYRTTDIITISAFEEGEEALPAITGAEVQVRELLEPTARPKDITPLPDGGICVLRWFQIDENNFDEFVALSDEAWVSLEKAFDVQIIGLFRATTAPQGKIRMLLYTWYASLAAWEISRDQRPEAGASEAWKRFIRRHSLTEFTTATVISEIVFP